MTDHWNIKGKFTESVNFGSVSKIGWVLTTFVLKNESIKDMIDQKLEIMRRKDLLCKFKKDEIELN